MASIGKYIRILCTAATMSACSLFAANEIPLLQDAPISGSGGRMTMRLDAAQYALESGLPPIAQKLAESVLENKIDNEEMESMAQGILADSLIAQGKFEEASRTLSSDSTDDTSENLLRRAIASLGMGKIDSSKSYLARVTESKLSRYGKYCLLIAQGYIDFEASDYENARKLFAKAKDLSKRKTLFASAEIADGMCALAGDLKDSELEKMATELAEKVQFYFGTKVGYEFAKQYAVVLNKLGRTDEALDVIKKQLSIRLPEDVSTGEISLIKISMEKNPREAFAELLSVMKNSASDRIVDFIIAVCQQNRLKSPEEAEKFLSEAVLLSPENSRDKFLLELAATQIALGKTLDAAETANKIVEDFPKSGTLADALRIVAWTSFYSDEGKAPQYRLAATSLMKLSEIEKDESAANSTKLLAADCYYLNKDYDTAANIYKSLFDAKGINFGIALTRAMESTLARGDDACEAAEKLLDSAYDLRNENFQSDALWSGEWQLSDALEKTYGPQRAKDRIIKTLAEHNPDSALRFRLLWREAALARELGQNDDVIKICDDLSNVPDKTIASNAMLMKARALESKSDTIKDTNGSEKIFNQAQKAYEELRKKYPKSEAAMLSYLSQARALGNRERYEEAKKLCDALAKISPKFSYSALLDSASYSRKIGMREDYLNALHTLDKLINDNPDDERNFYARLEQGEIMRLLNSFADAKALYTDMTNRYADHPDVRLAWMGLGESTLAQSGESSAIDASRIFERMYALPNASLGEKAEAACKWAFASEKAGRSTEADEIRWLTATALLKSLKSDATALEESKRSLEYWTSRILLDLAKSLESRGSIEESESIYKLIISENLPSAEIAKEKLKRQIRQ